MEHKQPPFNLMERGGTGVKKKNERRKREYGVAARLIAFIVSLVFLTQGIGQVWAAETEIVVLDDYASSENNTEDIAVENIPEQDTEEIILHEQQQYEEHENVVDAEEENSSRQLEMPAIENEVVIEAEPSKSSENMGDIEQENVGLGSRDTVLVLDASGSMRGTPISELKKAALNFCSSVLQTAENNRVAIVRFSNYGEKICDFTNDKTLLENAIQNLSASGSTNTTDAMKVAYRMIEISSADIKNIVLMADGQTECGESSNSGPYTSGPYYNYANALYQAVIPMHDACNIYTMGFFHSFSSSKREFFSRVLSDIQNAGYYEVEDSEDLNFIFGEVADEISNEDKIKEEEYIRIHKEFLEGDDYALFRNGWNAADQMLKKYEKLFSNYLGWKLVTMNISENPYDIVLADLVLSQENVDAQSKMLDFHVVSNINEIVDSLMTVIDEDGTIDTDTRNAIQKLFALDDVKDQKTFQLLYKKLDTVVSEDTLNKFFNMYTDGQIVGKFLGRGANIVNDVIDLVHYSAVVQAFAQTSKEFRQVLLLASYTSGDAFLQASVIEYCSIASQQDISEKLADKMWGIGAGQILGISNDLFEETICNGTKKFLLDNMDLSSAGTAVASKVNSFIAGCKIGYEVGKIFCNIFFNSDDTASTFLVAYSTAKLTLQLKDALESFEYGFKRSGDFRDAKLFCEAFSLYRRGQMLTVDKLIEYLGAQQNALIADKYSYIAEMYQWLVFKAEWQGVCCHDSNTVPDVYKDTKRKFVIIACPTDVEVTDLSGNVVVRIANGNLEYVKDGFVAAVSNQVKHILLPSDAEYRVNITSTGEGSMQYSVCEFQEDHKMEEGVLCQDIPLKQGEVYEGALLPEQSPQQDAKLKNDGEEIDCKEEAFDGDVVKQLNFAKSSLTVYKGKTVALKLSVTPSSLQAEKMTWNSSNTSVASVTSQGVVKGNKKGKAVITATSSNGIKVACTITVKEILSKAVRLSAKNVSLYKGQSRTLKAAMTPGNSTDTLKWSSSNKKVVTVTSKGVIKAVGKGKAVIKAVTSSGKKVSCSVTVKDIKSTAVKLKKSSLTLTKGKTFSLLSSVSPKAASGTVRWTTSDKKVASVSDSGTVMGVSDGTATITAMASNGKKAVCKVRVMDYRIRELSLDTSSLVLEKGEEKLLKAKALPVYAREEVYWKSSNDKVVSVSDNGRIKALKSGEAVVTAFSSSGVKAACQVEVVQPVEKIEVQEKLSLTEGVQYLLKTDISPSNATNQTLRFTTNNYKVAIVSGRGVIKAKAPGIAVITVRSSNGIEASCTVTVNAEIIVPKKITLDKESADMKVGDTLKLTAAILPENSEDKTVKWSSSNTSVAEVKNGIVTAKKGGTAEITATTVNGKKAVCKITVEEDELRIQIQNRVYNCKIGDDLEVTAAIHLNQKIELNQKKYILYYAYLNGGRWEEIGSYNIDGKNYFERRWEGPATVESYKIDGNNAEVTLKFPETSIFKEGKQWLVLSIFPYDHFTTGATLLDYMFYVNFQQ